MLQLRRFFVFAIAIASMTLFSQTSHARSFYEATFKMNVQYTNIESGTVDLISERLVNVRYSDDHDFCEIVIGTEAFRCHSYHPDDYPDQVALTMDRGIGGQVVAAALNNCMTDPNIQASFARLSTYLDDTINVEWQGDDFYQQIHDEIPESFHIRLYDMTQGVKY